MSEQYRLVYSGEVLEGQHAAVVKKRLQAVLKLDDARMDVLFSGKSVVVKKATDDKTAARYQTVFDTAGARLRVLPVEGDDGELSSTQTSESQTPGSLTRPDPIASSAAPTSVPASTPIPASGESGTLGVLPAGADILSEQERQTVASVEVDTEHLKLQGATFAVDEAPGDTASAPNVDHISLAELGVELGNPTDAEVLVEEIDVDFGLAEVGTIIGEPDAQAPVAPVDIDQIDFDLADAGAELDTSDKKLPPPAPDTSHIKLDDD